MNRISQIVRNEIGLLNHKVEASTNQSGGDTPPEDAIDHILIDAFAPGIALDNP